MMGLMDWSRTSILRITDAYRKSASKFGEMEAAVFENENLEVPIERAGYVAIDTELTGLDEKKDSIISIGAIRMVGRRIYINDTFYSLVKPVAELTGDTVVIHGITPSDVKEGPGIDEVLPQFLEFCGSDVMVGYLPALDMAFLNREMRRLYGLTIKNPVVDVFTAHKWMLQRKGKDNTKNLSLYEIAKDLGVEVKGAHNAISDAFITAQVLQRLIHTLSNFGVKSVGELLKVSNPSKGGDRFRFSTKINSL